MDALGPQSGGGQFFKDFVDNKQVPTQQQVLPDARQDLERRWNPSFLEKAALKTALTITDAGEGVYDYFSQTPEFLSNMWDFWGEAWEPKFEGHVPWLDATVVGPVADTALTLGSGFLTGAVSGLEGIARGFSLDKSGLPTHLQFGWSGVDADEAIAHRAANFPSYHPQTTMGRDVEHLVGGLIEGWGEHVGQPAGRFVQSAAEWAGADKESAIHWGGVAAGGVSAGPLVIPLLRKSRVPSNKPMYEWGFSLADMRLALEDQIGSVNNFQFMSDAWRKINPEAWRAALEKDIKLKDGSFAREIQRIQDVVTQDLRDVGFFIDQGKYAKGEASWKGLPKESWGEYIRRLWRDKNDVRMRYGKKGRHPVLDPLDQGQGGYFLAGNKTTGLFQRDATGKMLPNWGRGYSRLHPQARQRHIVVGKEGPRARDNRWTPKHEWTHALDDILYNRLAREATSMDQLPAFGPQAFLGEMGMVPDYMGRNRWIPELSRYNRANTMMSDLSPILKDFSEKIVEVEWTKYTEEVYDKAYTATKERLIGEGVTPFLRASEAEAALIARASGRKAIEKVEATKHKIIGEEGGIWSMRSPLELRARLTGANDFLALSKKTTYDKLQNPTGTRPFKLKDLWTEDIPARVREVRNMIDDLVAYDVMTRPEATAYLKKLLDEVREPYTKLTTEFKIGPGPGLLNGGEE